MVENNPVSAAGHPDMDYAEHEATYSFFLRFLKYNVVAIIVVLIFLAFMWG